MREIKLTQNKIAFVDDEDFDFLSKFKWYAVKGSRTYYASRFVERKEIRMHNILIKHKKRNFIDHIDHNGLNNQKSNLRVCTKQQNNMNKLPMKGGTSKFLGVCWSQRAKKWRSTITHNGKNIHIGYYANEVDAAKAYNAMAKELFGEFANLNIF